MSSYLMYEKLVEELCKDFRNDSGMDGEDCELLHRLERLLTHIKNENRRKLVEELKHFRGDFEEEKCDGMNSHEDS